MEPLPVASSWNATRLLVTAVVTALAVFVLGLAAASLVPPPRAAAAPETGVAGAVELGPGPDDEVEIADGLSVARSGSLVPASVEHLTVVQVSVSVCEERRIGSGVIVADGLLLTAAHAVGDAGLVRIDHAGVTVTGEVLGVAPDGRDLALIRVDAPMSTPIPAADPPAPGDPITLVGHPDGGPRTVLVGPAVDVAPVVAQLAGCGDIIGADVSITAGISGGAAVDESGALIGIVVAKEEATDTALVLAVPDLAQLSAGGLVPGACEATA